MAFKNKITAFSLIEIIVGITISLLLMVSIGVFVTSGMENIFLQQKLMQNTLNINKFTSVLYEYSLLIDKKEESFIGGNLGVFKLNKSNDKGGFLFIGTKSIDGYYCDEKNINDYNTETNHVFIRSFIPYIEKGETIEDLLKIIESNEIILGSKIYKSIQNEHKIVDNNGEIIIGRGIFGDEFKEGDNPKKIYLNSPTGLETDGEVLYLSDTLNNRILYLKDDKIHLLLDESDGLDEPTGLYFDSSDKILYIANSGKGEILSLTSKKIQVPNIIKFSKIEENGVNNIKLSFFKDGESINLDSNISISNFSFSNYPNHKKEIFGNSIQYYFKKDLTQSGVIIGQEDDFFDFSSSIEYSIGLDGLNLFEEVGTYTYELELGNTKKEGYYFTQGDDKLYTKGDNILKIVHKGLNYPTGIWGKDNFNELVLSDTEFSQKLGGVKQNIYDLDINKNIDIILKTPIDSFDLDRKNDLINFNLKYFKNFNCYNTEENSLNTLIYKINTK